MRRPASLVSVEARGGRAKRRARSECEYLALPWPLVMLCVPDIGHSSCAETDYEVSSAVWQRREEGRGRGGEEGRLGGRGEEGRVVGRLEEGRAVRNGEDVRGVSREEEKRGARREEEVRGVRSEEEGKSVRREEGDKVVRREGSRGRKGEEEKRRRNEGEIRRRSSGGGLPRGILEVQGQPPLGLVTQVNIFNCFTPSRIALTYDLKQIKVVLKVQGMLTNVLWKLIIT